MDDSQGKADALAEVEIIKKQIDEVRITCSYVNYLWLN